jgi:hypothetical protein
MSSSFDARLTSDADNFDRAAGVNPHSASNRPIAVSRLVRLANNG